MGLGFPLLCPSGNPKRLHRLALTTILKVVSLVYNDLVLQSKFFFYDETFFIKAYKGFIKEY
jgi:hypothetical protein